MNGNHPLVRLLLDHGALAEGNTFSSERLPFYIPLWVASHCGHFNIVRLLVSRGASPNTGCLAGFPWAEAFRKGHMEIFNYFLEGKEEGDLLDEQGEVQQPIAWQLQFDAAVGRNGDTPLNDACRRGNIEFVRFLLSKGVQPMTASSKKPHFPLILAVARQANLELVKLLVEAGAEVNMPNLKGITPLHRASKKNSIDVAEYLIQQGADVNIESFPFGREMKETKWPGTPLCHAATPEMIRLLMHHGAKLTWNEQAAGPLCTAVEAKKLDNVKCLISEFNADPNEGIGSSCSPLWAAVINATKSPSIASDPSLKESQSDSTPPSPSTASEKSELPMVREFEMIQFLVESGADVNQCNPKKNTPLVFIISCFDKSEFAGRDLSWSEQQVETAASQMEFRHANLEWLTDKFIELGAEVNKPGLSGTTPLQQVLFLSNIFFGLNHLSLSLGFKTDETSKFGFVGVVVGCWTNIIP